MLKQMRRKTSRMSVIHKHDAAMKKAKHISGELLPKKSINATVKGLDWTKSGILHTIPVI